MFTSGTGGAPKGVVLTYGNHDYNALASNQNIQLQADDCWLAVLPFYHVGGYAILFRTALAGCSAYIMSRFDIHRVNALIDDGMITHLSLVPTMLESLLDERGGREMPASLKAILIGGAPAARSLIDRARSLPVMRTYGMTETSSQLCTTPPNASFEKMQTSGKPLKYSEVAILDDGGSPVGEKQTGEIAVRGGILFKGYVGEKVGSSLDSSGWFRTGDVGHIDEDGYLCVSGRIDDMFISGGENIHLSEIENAALGFSGVSECAAIAIDDSEWGKRPVLFVRWSDESVGDIDSLRDHLKCQLPRFAVPKAIVEIDELPRRSIDKIDNEKLREIYLANSDDHD
jgi:O-succinylbenzoic acid--CoA ligase